MPIDKLCPDDFRNIGEVLVMQNSINVFLALLAKLLNGPEFPGLLVFILKFL